MKYGIFITLFAFLFGSASAFAYPSICSENVDHGYSAQFSSDMSSVEIISTTIAESTLVANLNCSLEESSSSNRIFVLATCYEPNLVDAGFSLVVKQNSQNGSTTAVLSEISFVGASPVAEMSCQ